MNKFVGTLTKWVQIGSWRRPNWVEKCSCSIRQILLSNKISCVETEIDFTNSKKKDNFTKFLFL